MNRGEEVGDLWSEPFVNAVPATVVTIWIVLELSELYEDR